MKVIVGAEQLRQIVIPLDCVIDLLTDADVAAAGGRNRLAVDAAKFIWQLRVNLKWIPGEIYNHKDTLWFYAYNFTVKKEGRGWTEQD